MNRLDKFIYGLKDLSTWEQIQECNTRVNSWIKFSDDKTDNYPTPLETLNATEYGKGTDCQGKSVLAFFTLAGLWGGEDQRLELIYGVKPDMGAHMALMIDQTIILDSAETEPQLIWTYDMPISRIITRDWYGTTDPFNGRIELSKDSNIFRKWQDCLKRHDAQIKQED